MSYLTFAEQLQSVAAKLRANANQLEGKTLATAASTLGNALLSFEKKLMIAWAAWVRAFRIAWSC